MSVTITPEDHLTWRLEGAEKNFRDARQKAADELTRAVDEDLRVTSWQAEAVVTVGETQAEWEAWRRVAARVEGGETVEAALGFIVRTLLSVTQPGNSTGHGHRAFDTGTHEGTLRALRGMTDMAGWFSKEEEKKA